MPTQPEIDGLVARIQGLVATWGGGHPHLTQVRRLSCLFHVRQEPAAFGLLTQAVDDAEAHPLPLRYCTPP
jgi:hypothetical protein